VQEFVPQKAIAHLQERLSFQDVHFFPVRHHSPACSWHLARFLRQVQPRAVLIEGPSDLTALIPCIVSPQTRTPIAAFSTYIDKARRVKLPGSEESDLPPRFAGYYPMCDYSPELVALRIGTELGARLRFIDLTFPSQVLADKRARNPSPSVRMMALLEENYLRSSHYVQALVQRNGCRDSDELWDHLFEVGCTELDTDTFIRRVAAYCLLARGTQDAQVLRVDGTIAREHAMAGAILEEMAAQSGAPIVVVTGGFHTAALPDMVHDGRGKRPSAPADGSSAGADGPAFTSEETTTCLMAYSFDQLDALNGYGSGMPLPAYYDSVWTLMNSGSPSPLLEAAGMMVVEVGQFIRDKNLAVTISAADEIAAMAQARRLAQVRGHGSPTREDVLDAMRSCFVPGAMDAEGTVVMGLARQVLSGWSAGCVAPEAGVPPLVDDFRRSAAKLGLKIDDSLAKEVVLDVYRKPSHRRTSRFFNQLIFLNVPFASLLRGADFSAGVDVELIQEQWRYAWSPAVEGRLIEESVHGQTLEQAALSKLQEAVSKLEEQGQGRCTLEVVSLLMRACQMGLQDSVARIGQLLKEEIAEDPALHSLVTGLEQLLLLRQARQTLEAGDLALVHDLAQAIYTKACYVLGDLANITESEVEPTVRAIASLREIVASPDQAQFDTALFERSLREIVSSPRRHAAVFGAAAGVLYGQDKLSEDDLMRYLAGTLNAATADRTGRTAFVRGLLATCREAAWRSPRLLQQLTELLDGWDEEEFLLALPELRLAFADLTPREIDKVAEAVAQMHGQADLGELVHHETTEQEMALHVHISRAVAAALNQQKLSRWVQSPEGTPS
jgi:hypothetical protein